MKFMASLVAKLPGRRRYEWTGLSYQEALSSKQAPALSAISLVVVFLALAALYEARNSVLGDVGCSVRRRWRITGHQSARLK
ncbi:efflux RND transporter permease subunit [Shigella flexneri]